MKNILLLFAVGALLGGCSVFERVTVTATDFSIPRFTNYPTMTLQNVTLQDDESHTVLVEADCVEEVDEGASMKFSNTVVLEPNQPMTVQVPYESGDQAFTDSTVQCRFTMQTTGAGGPQVDFVLDD